MLFRRFGLFSSIFYKIAPRCVVGFDPISMDASATFLTFPLILVFNLWVLLISRLVAAVTIDSRFCVIMSIAASRPS